jgi:hypothetical protein
MLLNRFLPLLFIGFILAGCGKKDAQLVADAYYKAIAQDSIDKAMGFFDDAAVDENGAFELEQFLISLEDKFGELKTWDSQGWHVNSEWGENKRAELIYKVEYADYTTTDKLILEYIDEEWRIVGVNVDPEGYIEDALEEELPEEAPV